MPTVLINNPFSRKNRRVRDRFTLEARACLGERFYEPSTHPDLMCLATELQARRVKTVAISGGDGTISDVMTALHRAYGQAQLPALSIFPSGNSNLIARDVGFRQRSLANLQRLLQAPHTLSRQIRTTLKVSWTDDTANERLGMFHGTTGFSRAINIAHAPRILKWAPHNLAVAVTLGATLMQLCRRKYRSSWLAGDVLRLKSGEALISDANSFFFVATALEKLSMGIWPFWNESKGSGEKGVRFLNVGSDPQHLWRAASLLLRGKTAPWLRRHPSYKSDLVQALDLTGPRTFVLDGESFDTGPSRHVRVVTGPRFDFLHN